ncbi:MAG: hypothetical protein ACRC45_01215 [Cetobacterium sp.]
MKAFNKTKRMKNLKALCKAASSVFKIDYFRHYVKIKKFNGNIVMQTKKVEFCGLGEHTERYADSYGYVNYDTMTVKYKDVKSKER